MNVRQTKQLRCTPTTAGRLSQAITGICTQTKRRFHAMGCAGLCIPLSSLYQEQETQRHMVGRRRIKRPARSKAFGLDCLKTEKRFAIKEAESANKVAFVLRICMSLNVI